MTNKYETYGGTLQGIDETNILFPRNTEDVLDAFVLETFNKKTRSVTFQLDQPNVEGGPLEF
ncbi:MAG TPA: hypothetical protein VEG61_05000 [Candidatus Dormibacteraeota bacterium]|nr:hypothetical protein [Candidatus Dormibacteraeota bacterium]